MVVKGFNCHLHSVDERIRRSVPAHRAMLALPVPCCGNQHSSVRQQAQGCDRPTTEAPSCWRLMVGQGQLLEQHMLHVSNYRCMVGVNATESPRGVVA
jgi:hypothetical protein